jgi:hypothetical protein
MSGFSELLKSGLGQFIRLMSNEYAVVTESGRVKIPSLRSLTSLTVRPTQSFQSKLVRDKRLTIYNAHSKWCWPVAAADLTID